MPLALLLVRSGVAGAAALCGALAIVVSGSVALSLLNAVRPPQPIPLGEVAMAYECGFRADTIRRTSTIGGRHAAGEFFLVEGAVVCPFGERFRWRPDAVFVASNGRGTRWTPDLAATAALDPGAVTPHAVIGAEDHVRLAFDLPAELPQPALVFAPAVDSGALLDAWRQLKPYAPHRFNLRFDPLPLVVGLAKRAHGY